jgi:DNA excision repair protein ERCC-2
MYSATLSLHDLKLYKKSLRGSKRVQKSHKRLFEYMESMRDERDDVYEVNKEYDQTLLDDIKKLVNDLETALGDQVFDDNKLVLELYFELAYFFKIAEFYRDEMRFVIERAEDTTFNIKCLDASHYIKLLFKKKLKSLIFFSATMIPLEYYQQLLTRGLGEHIYLPSPFEKEHLKIMIPSYISTRYKDRKNSIYPIIEMINTMLNTRDGNYIIFFPSYKYLNDVVDYMVFENDTTYLIQEPTLTKEERAEYIESFRTADTRRVIGLFVLGGMFSEGIDYVGDMLDGVMIIGLGLPGFGDENEMLKSYFDDTFNQGIDYAYTYPGFNKVIQGVGRVIRTIKDRGYAVLVDDRYLNYKYTRLLLPEWKPVSIVHNADELKEEINNFYK